MTCQYVAQPRCPQCLIEHPALAVRDISHGWACPDCGHAKIYERIEDYRADLAAARARHRPD